MLHLARLAVDRTQRGKGLGEELLMHAFQLAINSSETAGLFAVETIAKDERARSFYEKYGFRALIDDRLHLYISISTLQDAYDAAT